MKALLGFYAGMLHLLSAAFIWNCIMFNADGTVLHVGKLKGTSQMPSMVADAHAEDTAPRNIGVITAKDKEIIQSAIDYCKAHGVSAKGLPPCIERESKAEGLK